MLTPEQSAPVKLECWKTPFLILAPLIEMLEKFYPDRQIWAATKIVIAFAAAVMHSGDLLPLVTYINALNFFISSGSL
jgi:hypothetical protein